tara:strand:+ start:606 stop:728 length:123 start_codon:yes stop_codon:yes gene_type:complete
MVKISIVRGCSSAGRAPAWHAGGRGSNPLSSTHKNEYIIY